MSQSAAESTAPGTVPEYLLPVHHDFSPLSKQILIVLAALGLLGCLCAVDLITGPKFHVGLLNIAPVIIAAWFAGRCPGYTLAVAACAVWFWIGRPASDGNGILVNGTNLLVRISFYGVIIELLVMFRDFNRRLEYAVQQRTAQLQLEVAERERAQASLRELAGQLSEAEDVERRRIAYDIHDGLSQMLGVVKMNLETVVAETAIDTRQFERLTDLVKVLNDLIQQAREMTFELHPSMLDHFGLVPTLLRFAEDFERRTLAEVTISETGERLVLTSTLASYLFRAIKEVVNNAVKHGNAKEIIVGMHWEMNHLRCVVDDDGSGFDPVKAMAPQERRGLGLAGMDERLTSLGGKLRIESQPGSGARVILEVPIAPVAAPVEK